MTADLLELAVSNERKRIAQELRSKASEYHQRADEELQREHPFMQRVRGLRDVAANLTKQANRIAANQPLVRPKGEGST